MLRIAGHDATAADALAAALHAHADGQALPIQGRPPALTPEARDPFQIDRALALEPPGPADAPISGVSYAGLTPSQRMAFLQWTLDATRPAPPAFQRLYVANLEVGLLDPEAEAEGKRQAIRRELLRCALSPAWRDNEWLARALLLALWLSANGAGIAEWLATVDVPPAILGLAIGLQALLEEPLRPAQMTRLAARWNLPNGDLPPEILTLRLSSVTAALGAPPLAVALQRAPDGAAACLPWRSAHPSLRFALPQPDLRPTLEPLLADMLAVNDADVQIDAAPQDDAEPEREPIAKPRVRTSAQSNKDDTGWRLILEFGESRSNFNDHVIELCRRLPEYTQLMDEDRRLVHRVAFRKADMRRFWRIWDYVQNWSSTHVYLNGNELDKWKVWPYSKNLR